MRRKDSVARRILQRPTAVSLHYHPGVRPLPTWLRLQSPIVYPPASGMVPPGLLENTHAPFSLCSRVSLRHDPNLKLSAWPGVPHWQAQPMEPVYPDDGAVPADRRYSYAHKGTHPILRHGSVTGSYMLHWPPFQAVCNCRHRTSPARSLLYFWRHSADTGKQLLA